MLTFHIQGPMDMFILCFDKCFLFKVHLMLWPLSSTKIVCPTLSLKEDIVVEMDL